MGATVTKLSGVKEAKLAKYAKAASQGSLCAGSIKLFVDVKRPVLACQEIQLLWARSSAVGKGM